MAFLARCSTPELQSSSLAKLLQAFACNRQVGSHAASLLPCTLMHVLTGEMALPTRHPPATASTTPTWQASPNVSAPWPMPLRTYCVCAGKQLLPHPILLQPGGGFGGRVLRKCCLQFFCTWPAPLAHGQAALLCSACSLPARTPARCRAPPRAPLPPPHTRTSPLTAGSCCRARRATPSCLASRRCSASCPCIASSLLAL